MRATITITAPLTLGCTTGEYREESVQEFQGWWVEIGKLDGGIVDPVDDNNNNIEREDW